MMPAMPATQTTVFNRLTPLLRKPLFWLLALGALLGASVVQAQGIPLINATSAGGGTQYSLTLQLLALMTALTLLPSLLLMMTSFVRVIIVMSLLRQALGTGQTPPNMVLVGLALFLTFLSCNPSSRTSIPTPCYLTSRAPCLLIRRLRWQKHRFATSC